MKINVTTCAWVEQTAAVVEGDSWFSLFHFEVIETSLSCKVVVFFLVGNSYVWKSNEHICQSFSASSSSSSSSHCLLINFFLTRFFFSIKLAFKEWNPSQILTKKILFNDFARAVSLSFYRLLSCWREIENYANIYR